jgi:hypothetical protein
MNVILNTAAGWLMLLCHRPIRRLRTALFEGVQQKPFLVLSSLPEPGPVPACCVLAQDFLLAAFMFPSAVASCPPVNESAFGDGAHSQRVQTGNGTHHVLLQGDCSGYC